MKIAIVNTLYAPNKVGGAEKSVQILAEKLYFKGNDVIVICLGKENLTYELNGIIIYQIKIKNSYWPYDDINRGLFKKLKWHINDSNNKKYDDFLKQLFLNYKPNILLTNNISGFSTKLWSLASNLNIKIVHVLRDYYLQCPKTSKFKNNSNCSKSCLDCKLLSIPKKMDSSKVNYLIGISDYIIRDHINNDYFKEVKNRLIYNGFYIDKLKIKPHTHTNTFGFIGQIKKSKGIELLLKSFSKLGNLSWRLIIAGKINKNYLEYLQEINNSVRIEYVGYVDSTSFFEMIDVLVVPSLWNEPFGRVVLESIINKKPVIASNMGGIKELLSKNKKFIFHPKEDSLTDLIKKIILNKDFLGEFNFQKSLLDKFDIEKTVDQYLDVFNEILKE